MASEKVKSYLLSGEEARKPENVLGLFERLAGRKATDDERDELMQRTTTKASPTTRKILPTTRGRPASGPLGTGFGITGITTKGPKKPT